MKPIVDIRGLGKRYRLGMIGSTTLREAVNELWNRRPGGSGDKPRAAIRDFWALRDLSFTIERGQVVGILGRNGAGKSTLLKILSRITEPTCGEVMLRGRVSSLLEVGTGFHPELSGRENIFLNGAILGLKTAEIRARFDEIVAFAEVDEFLDTPVKRYSSGMYVRLAFAVAAHLDPDILLVDEVLAVGDQKFQQKCIGKMRDVSATEGRTVLFVSHNLANVRQLCSSAVLLSHGSLVQQGRTEEVIDCYLGLERDEPGKVVVGGQGIELCDVKLVPRGGGDPTDRPLFDRSYDLVIQFETHTSLANAMVVVDVFDKMGLLVSMLGTVEEGIHPFVMDGDTTVRFHLERLSLTPASYHLRISVYQWFDDHPLLQVKNALSFEVQAAAIGDALAPYQREFGIVRLARGVTLEQGSEVKQVGG